MNEKGARNNGGGPSYKDTQRAAAMERAKQRQQATNQETLQAKAVAGLGQLDAAQLAALRGLVAQGPAALSFSKKGAPFL